MIASMLAGLLAKRAWSNLKCRAGAKYNHSKAYTLVEVRMTRLEFLEWAIPEYERWLEERPDEKPSVDRKESDGHYEVGNLRLVELNENRTNNKRNKHRLAAEGKLYCYECEQYLPKEEFYVVSTVLDTKRNHWSGMCKGCTSKVNKQKWEDENGIREDPSGVCERCSKTLPLTESGKVSRARYCGSCRQKLWQDAHPDCLARQPEYNRKMSKERGKRYRERKRTEKGAA